MNAASDIGNPAIDESLPGGEVTEEQFLEAYKKKTYPKPSLTADIAVFRMAQEGFEVLLIRRGRHPYQGCWALPGGFAGPDEDVEDAARRELEEETGVVDVPLELFGIYGTPGRDPRGWTVSGGFCTLVDAETVVCAGDDAADARWCNVRESQCANRVDSKYEQSQAGADDERELTITCGYEETLAVRFAIVEQRFGVPRARVLESEGFAFDHARLLADAYLKVTNR